MKNVIITGASRGIGFELTKLFSDKGYKVIALSRSISKLNIPNVIAYQLDISCEKSILKIVKLILNDFSQVDILINKPFSQTSFNDFESIYKVNVFGLAELIRLLLPCFHKESHVVNISSIGGIGGSSKFPGLSAYSSSKGALNILTEMLSEEFKDSGPSFNCLALGAVQTEMLEEAFPGFQAKVSALEMANYIYNFSIEGNKLFNGKTIPVSTSNP